MALAMNSSALSAVSGPIVRFACIAAIAPTTMLTIQPTTTSRMSLLIDMAWSSLRSGRSALDHPA